ncbi:MAG: tetratricopeptide repeat protein [Deltaproteobacteria bacterium]|nr:tetratricopeptide repeat protein [Deltaproteobacteria bacterium]
MISEPGPIKTSLTSLQQTLQTALALLSAVIVLLIAPYSVAAEDIIGSQDGAIAIVPVSSAPTATITANTASNTNDGPAALQAFGGKTETAPAQDPAAAPIAVAQDKTAPPSGLAPASEPTPTSADETNNASAQTPAEVQAESATPVADEAALAAEAARKTEEEAELKRKAEAEEAAKAAAIDARQKEHAALINKKVSEVIEAAVSEDYAKMLADGPIVLAERPELASRLAPLLAYAYHRTGDTARALTILNERSDAHSLLMRAAITGEQVTPPGGKTPVSGVAVYAMKVGVPAAPGYETIAYKKSLLKALKESFTGKGDDESRGSDVFDRTIAPYAEGYYLNHYVLSQSEDGGHVYYFYIVMFIDAAKLAKAGAGAGAAGSGENHLKTILLSSKGGENVKKMLLADLLKEGFPAEDMGSGELTPATVDKTRGAIVIRVAADTNVSGKVLNSNFKSIKAALDYSIINGNNGVVISKLSRSHTLVNLNENEGTEAAIQKAYDKSLGPLTDAITDIETRMGKELASGLLPSIEASVRDLKEVFANIYKFYADEPVGTLILKNNTNNVYKSVRATFSIKGYMDYPTETVIDRLGPKEEKTVPIKAVFNNNVLYLTDNTLLQSELEVGYKESNGEQKSLKTRQPVQMYEKQALVWDDKGKVASFITYKDPVVNGFATKAVREYNYPYLPSSIVMARAIFGAMGVMGITYVPDPVPYSTVANITTMIDRVQYPRQTLARKAGDCDDLVALFAASLESLGIKAMPVDAPGHLFVIFDTGIAEKNASELGFQPELYVIHDGTVWIPFETTLVGSPFYLAWEKGAENYKRWKNEVKLVDLRQSWKSFAPATLPPDEFKQNITMAAIEKKFPNELDGIRRRKVEGAVKKALNSVEDKKATVILYGKNGMVSEAIKLAEELIKDGAKDDPSLLNNLGNLYFLNNDYDRALKSYTDASRLSPNDARIMVNLARTHLKLQQTKKAAEAFAKAVELDPGVKEEYLRLYTEIGK